MSAVSETTENGGRRGYRLGHVRCETCDVRADLFAAGWRAWPLDGPYTDELPALAFYCPDCATPEGSGSTS
jgi:hypothetical protein